MAAATTTKRRARRINRRIVNTKRHTVGYIITGNERISRSQAVRMAGSGELSGVRVVGGGSQSYIQSTNNDRRLYDLPEVVDNTMRANSRPRR